MSQPTHFLRPDAKSDFCELAEGFRRPLLTPQRSDISKPRNSGDAGFDLLPKSVNTSFDFSESFSPIALHTMRSNFVHASPELKLYERTSANTPDRLKEAYFADLAKAKAALKDVVPVLVDNSAKRGCVCKKTKCLKLYCECFANGGVCGPGCRCDNCHNTMELQDLRELIIQETLAKNPLAFKSKYKSMAAEDKKLHSRGCKCSKTGCQKNYCECFKKGLGCSALCRCDGCNNEKIELKEEEVRMYYDRVLRKRKKPNYIYEFYFEKYSSLKQKINKQE